MKPAPFESTPAFSNFTEVMRKLIQVPKSEVDREIEKREEAISKTKNRPGRKPDCKNPPVT